MDETLSELGEHIAAALGGADLSWTIAFGDLTVHTRPDSLLRVLRFLRDDASCRFVCLLDIAGVDYPEREQRFEVVSHLLSPTQNVRVRVKIAAGEDTQVPSTVDLFPSANWYEREVFDLYGVLFAGHPDLRRILTDYGFIGHPFRKDFPLSGNVEMRYDPTQQRVIYQPVSIEPRETVPRIVRDESYGAGR